MIEDAALSRAGLAFGPFLLLPERQVLLRQGERVRLGSRALDILILLVRRSGELVTKNEIVAHVWPDLVVEENNLRVHMVALRRALGDDPRSPTYIHNVTGRGYRFLAPVAEVNAPEPSADADPDAAPAQRPPAPSADADDGALAAEATGAAGHATAAAASAPTRGGPMAARQAIGRDDTVEGVAERLLQRRFLTIVGPGGIGKTSL
ncbi:MAG: winged helix-turn-helix domain-containing protein, partial [Rhodospirillales bacterium]|nr:winged helix-turn-helix domain-containing protein [Rhodospirillales bacterium]